MASPEITVAVPVKDRKDQMLRCLDALLAQDHPDFEILIVDNGSSDGTPEAVLERASGASLPVRVERLPGVLGAIRNEAGRIARGEFLAFTDSDCVPDPGWLTAAARALRENPSWGVVQGRTLPEVPPTQGWPATIRVEEFTGLYEGCNLAFRRQAFVESDGFDEQVGHYWEDTAAGLAIKRAGWDAGYEPDALVYHDVTYPGFWWHVKRMGKHQNLAPILSRYPDEVRSLLFWRVFLAPRDARFTGLFLGALLVLLGRRGLGVGFALPYVVSRIFEDDWSGIRGNLINPKSHAQAVVIDAARQLGVIRGAIRERQLLL